MNERKKLPCFVATEGICREDSEGRFWDMYGAPVGRSYGFRKRIVNNGDGKKYWYADIEGYDLVFYVIKADDEGFYAEVSGRLSWNQYDELCGDPGVDIKNPEVAVNTEAVRLFLMPVYVRQPFYKACMEYEENPVEASFTKTLKLLSIFFEKKHKTLQLLFNEGYINDYAGDILKGESKNYERMNKRHLQIAKKYKADLSNVINMCEKYNAQELDWLCSMFSYFGYHVRTMLSFIDRDIPIDSISAFGSYFLKNILCGNLHIHDGSGWAKDFLEEYRDYLLMRGNMEEFDLYPENLHDAHQELVDRTCICSGGKTYSIPLFKAATGKYADLAWSNGEGVEAIVPDSPEDLIKESAAMHNCVKSYIDRVINEECKIVLLKKDGVSYMTVEIIRNEIVQVKRKCNKEPDEEDRRIITEFALAKNLVY